MALAVSSMTFGDTTSNLTDYPTAATSFVAGRLYLAGWEYSRSDTTDPGAPASLTTTGLTWSLITGYAYKNTAGNRMGMSAWYCVPGSNVTSQTTTANMGYTGSGACWSIVEVTGQHATPYAQATTGTVGASIGIGATSTMITLGSPADSDSRPFFFFGSNNNVLTYGLEAGYALLNTGSGHITPSELLLTAWNSTAWDASQTLTNNTGSATVCGMIALELKAAAVAAPSGSGFLSLMAA